MPPSSVSRLRPTSRRVDAGKTSFALAGCSRTTSFALTGFSLSTAFSGVVGGFAGGFCRIDAAMSRSFRYKRTRRATLPPGSGSQPTPVAYIDTVAQSHGCFGFAHAQCARARSNARMPDPAHWVSASESSPTSAC